MSTDIGVEGSPEGYHFREIEEIKPAMVKATSLLKPAIESGLYDVLVSDDIGARVPTIILRNIIKLARPAEPGLPVYFIQGGHPLTNRRTEGVDKISEFIKSRPNHFSHALLVSELIFNGRTLEAFKEAFTKAGVDFDALVLYSYMDDVFQQVKENFEAEGSRLYVTGDYSTVPGHNTGRITFSEKNPWKMTGVVHNPYKGYQLHPVKPLTAFEETKMRQLTEEEMDQIFDIKPDDLPWVIAAKLQDSDKTALYEQELKKPYTDIEIQQMNHRVAQARKDCQKLAREVYQEVWLNKK